MEKLDGVLFIALYIGKYGLQIQKVQSEGLITETYRLLKYVS